MALDLNPRGRGSRNAATRDASRRDTPAQGGLSPDEIAREALQETEIRGLDALQGGSSVDPRAQRLWKATWPKLAAIAIALGLWQLVVLSGWREEYVLPGPAAAFADLGKQLFIGDFWAAIAVTLTRGVVGFAVASVLGLILGIAVARSRVLRAAIGSLITGLQTMPSIAWFPLAILLFQLSEQAILFVILIGAVPSIANGVINGVDYVPGLLVRAGRNIGASGLSLYRHVVLPAALPSIVSGLKQGWAFAWRSLLAGELIVAIANRPSLGQYLNQSRELGDTAYMIALMITILAIGIAVDAVFGVFERGIRRRRGVVIGS